SGTSAQTSGNYTRFFLPRLPCEIAWVSEIHSVLGTDGGAVTLDVVKVPSGSAVSAGTSLLASTFNLKSTINTPVTKEGTALTSTSGGRSFVAGDAIGLLPTGTLTAVQNVHVTAY